MFPFPFPLLIKNKSSIFVFSIPAVSTVTTLRQEL